MTASATSRDCELRVSAFDVGALEVIGQGAAARQPPDDPASRKVRATAKPMPLMMASTKAAAVPRLRRCRPACRPQRGDEVVHQRLLRAHRHRPAPFAQRVDRLRRRSGRERERHMREPLEGLRRQRVAHRSGVRAGSAACDRRQCSSSTPFVFEHGRLKFRWPPQRRSAQQQQQRSQHARRGDASRSVRRRAGDDERAGELAQRKARRHRRHQARRGNAGQTPRLLHAGHRDAIASRAIAGRNVAGMM